MMATQRVVPSSARLADLRPDHSPYLPLIGANGHRRGKAMDQDSWDRALLELSGPLMQSWRWGEYKRSQGWEVERVCVSTPTGTAMAQLLFNHLGPTSLAYVPQGPVLTGDGPAVFARLVEAMDEACQRHRAANLILAPASPLPLRGTFKGVGFVRGPQLIHSQTITVPLGSDEQLLAQMHKQTRRGIRRGQERGVRIEIATAADPAAFAAFYRLLGETAQRHGFSLRPREWYEEALRLFGDDAVLMLARLDDTFLAGELAVRFGEEASSLFGCSSAEQRTTGATAYLEYAVLRWARDRGCRRLDLGGTQGALFKLGFGGEVVTYPPTLERRYRTVTSWLLRRGLAAYCARARSGSSRLG